MTLPVVPLLLDGVFTPSAGSMSLEVQNPATGQALAQVTLATPDEINKAVASAKNAFLSWKEVPSPERARLMMRYQALLKEHQEDLARLLARETGKTLADARGDVWRGIEVVEQAAGISSMLMGETAENVARGVDIYSLIQPLGVCLGITPFNFPAMIPLWMFPLAIACGNTFILKPSEQVPLTPTRLAELFMEAGCPSGVLQVIHGGASHVQQLLEHPDIKAVSFVGSVPVGEIVYRTATQHLKRVQCMAGAKNHMVIMPDADKTQVINALAGAACGAAGQRCMAISVAIFVGEAQAWQHEVADALQQLKPGLYDDPAAAFGPLISSRARARVLDLIETGKKEGAVCLLDGSQATVDGAEDGHWIGATLFTGVTAEMRIYREEIFGPVLSCMEVDTLDAAIQLINANPYGNGCSLFTRSGAAARKFQHHIEVGQVGINIPIPVPLPFFSFTGWRKSFYGDLHAYGKQAVRFYTETKTITTRWPEESQPSELNTTIQLR